MNGLIENHILNHRKYGTMKVFLYAIALCFSAFIGFAFATFSSAHAQEAAQSQVSLSSEVFIERTEIDADGNEQIMLKTPKDVVVIPGDRLKFILSYSNNTGQDVTGFKATNPIPSAVAFIDAREDWAQVSVDGGKNWGKLEDLTVETRDESAGTIVTRAASNLDVTHVRWVFNDSIANGAKGELSYNGTVK